MGEEAETEDEVATIEEEGEEEEEPTEGIEEDTAVGSRIEI